MRNGHNAQSGWVFEMVVTSCHANQFPTISRQNLDQFGSVHGSMMHINTHKRQGKSAQSWLVRVFSSDCRWVAGLEPVSRPAGNGAGNLLRWFSSNGRKTHDRQDEPLHPLSG